MKIYREKMIDNSFQKKWTCIQYVAIVMTLFLFREPGTVQASHNSPKFNTVITNLKIPSNRSQTEVRVQRLNTEVNTGGTDLTIQSNGKSSLLRSSQSVAEHKSQEATRPVVITNRESTSTNFTILNSPDTNFQKPGIISIPLQTAMDRAQLNNSSQEEKAEWKETNALESIEEIERVNMENTTSHKASANSDNDNENSLEDYDSVEIPEEMATNKNETSKELMNDGDKGIDNTSEGQSNTDVSVTESSESQENRPKNVQQYIDELLTGRKHQRYHTESLPHWNKLRNRLYMASRPITHATTIKPFFPKSNRRKHVSTYTDNCCMSKYRKLIMPSSQSVKRQKTNYQTQNQINHRYIDTKPNIKYRRIIRPTRVFHNSPMNKRRFYSNRRTALPVHNRKTTNKFSGIMSYNDRSSSVKNRIFISTKSSNQPLTNRVTNRRRLITNNLHSRATKHRNPHSGRPRMSLLPFGSRFRQSAQRMNILQPMTTQRYLNLLSRIRLATHSDKNLIVQNLVSRQTGNIVNVQGQPNVILNPYW